MYPILVVLVAAAQTAYYEAKVATFGCNSIAEVHELQKVRADTKAFQRTMIEKQIEGQCVTILKGTLVQGSIESKDHSILRVNEKSDPPGYEAPLADFAIKEAPKDPQ